MASIERRLDRIEARLDGRGEEFTREPAPGEPLQEDGPRRHLPSRPSLEDTEGLDVALRKGDPFRLLADAEKQDQFVSLGYHDGNHVSFHLRVGDLRALHDLKGYLDRLTARLEEAERDRDENYAFVEIAGWIKEALALHYGEEHMESVPPMMYNDAIKRLVRENKILVAHIESVEQERDELETTMNLWRKAAQRATESWRSEDPEGRALVIPDLAKQFTWSFDRILKLERERDEAERMFRNRDGRLLEAKAEIRKLRQRLEGMVEAMGQEYAELADIRNQWPGRYSSEGQARLTRMRDAIAEATGRSLQDVQDDYTNRALRGEGEGDKMGQVTPETKILEG